MVDHSAMKLGKLAPRHDPRVRGLARYMTGIVPEPPPARDWTKGVKTWGMMENDVLSCCTAAGVAHAIQVWTLNTRHEWTAGDDEVVAFYSATTGYKPGDLSTDQGGIEVDVLSYLLKSGFFGRHIVGFAAMTPRNTTLVRQAINAMGGVYVGVALPFSAQSQDVWDVPSGGPVGDGEPGGWGGHCVFVAAYDEAGLTCITWGGLKRMTWAFWSAYVDEAYAILAGAWINQQGRAPSGFDVATLEQDMQALR